jgi:hypothetical protein
MFNDDKEKILIEYVSSNRRVYPNNWVELYGIGREEVTQRGISERFPPSLILGGSGASNAEKRLCLISQINFAARHGFLDKVDEYIRSKLDDEWYYGSIDELGYDELSIIWNKEEDEIASEGLKLCRSLVELEAHAFDIELTLSKLYSDESAAQEIQLYQYLGNLKKQYPLTVNELNTMIDRFQSGLEATHIHLQFLAWQKNGTIDSNQTTEELYWKDQSTGQKALIIKLKLLQLYERYRASREEGIIEAIDEDLGGIIWARIEDETATKLPKLKL